MFLLLFIFINNYPFSRNVFDQYHGDAGVVPFQNYIDYIHDHGGLVFWAHPEIENDSKIGNTGFSTGEHLDKMALTKNYDGYSIFYDGYEKVGFPGGLWDALLKDYCDGKRERPVWAIAGLALDTSSDIYERIMDLNVTVFAREKSYAGILEALGSGKVYMARGAASSALAIKSFSISAASERAYMGDTLAAGSGDRLLISLSGEYTKDKQVNIKLIKDGKVIKRYAFDGIFNVEYSEEFTGGACFYRIEIDADGLLAVTNPIFIKAQER